MSEATGEAAREAEGQAAVAREIGAPPGDSSSLRILVAEDDPAAAAVLDTLLRLSGYEVLVVADGTAALAQLDACPPPDLLLLDWMLPGVSGLDICRAARMRWDPVALPILMVTARTDPESITGAFAAGANDYLTKPFLGSELRARIESHLRIRELVADRQRIDEHLTEREKLSSLGVLVSSVAHDLANPLGGILGHAQLLLEGEPEGERGLLVREILDSVERCNRIVGDLLAFARRRPAESETLDPARVLAETVALRERHLRAVGIRFETRMEAGGPAVIGVAHQLQQVFLNILINAEQALRGGGEHLAVTLGPASGGLDGADAVEIVFRNDGPPIPADVLARIFEPFFTTKPSDEGTGLGLAICDRVVRDHGGEIRVESAPEGTSFRVLLPVAGSGAGV